MLKFKPFPGEVEDLHLATLGERFDHQLNLWKSFTGYPKDTAKLHATLKRLRKEILVGDVQELRQVIDQVEAVMPDLSKYLRNRPRGKKRRPTSPMERLINQLNTVFNYALFDKKDDGWNAYKLVGKHLLRICPYCHMNHINYHMRDTRSSAALKLRPPLDHFLPKSIYPYLAVSLYNLIPCCDRCNSTTIKGAKDPEQTIPHPFDDSARNMTFKVTASALTTSGITDEEYALSVTGHGAWKEFADFFHLSERYQWYLPEVQDMLGRIQTLDDSDKHIEPLIIRPLFILGFAPHEAEQRALGICLLDIAKNLGALSEPQ